MWHNFVAGLQSCRTFCANVKARWHRFVAAQPGCSDLRLTECKGGRRCNDITEAQPSQASVCQQAAEVQRVGGPNNCVCLVCSD